MKTNNVESNVFADEENLCSKNECLLQQNCHVSTMKTTIYIRLLPDPVCSSKTDTMGSKPSYVVRMCEIVSLELRCYPSFIFVFF